MPTLSTICPFCSWPATPGAAFCENCGKESASGLPPLEASGARKAPSDPSGRLTASPSSAADGANGARRAAPAAQTAAWRPDAVHGTADGAYCARPAASPRPPAVRTPSRVALSAPSGNVRGGAAPTAPSSDAPFLFEWDDARQFIVGAGGAFAYKMRFTHDVDEVEIVADADGDSLQPATLASVQAGETREGLIPYLPKTPGNVTVSLRITLTMAGRVRETFEPKTPLRNMVFSDRRMDLLGVGGTININASGNTGINRFDGADFGGFGAVKVDRWQDERRVLDRPHEWRPVPFSSLQIAGSEIVRLCAGDRELTVVSGASRAYFGSSSHRATIVMTPETADGHVDAVRSRYISRRHFTIARKGEHVVLRDGGPEKGEGRGDWRSSRNGTVIDGEELVSDRILSPGKTSSVVLAPYSIPGGAMTLSIEARGHDGEIPGCDRPCDLSSVSITRGDAPNRPALVVWGGAEIDDLLGTTTGLHIGLIRGRLRLIRRSGSSTRLLHLVGTVLPGTDISVQPLH